MEGEENEKKIYSSAYNIIHDDITFLYAGKS